MDTEQVVPGSEPAISKRERREARRQEAQSGQRAVARWRVLRRVLLWAGVAVVLVGIGWAVYIAAKNAPSAGNGEGDLSIAVGDGDNMKGPADAPVTLVEYSDFQCPACGSFYPVLKELFDESEGKVRLVYRNFPLTNLHPNATLAARTAQAAGLQGKFWEMHDKLFEGQKTWSDKSNKGARETFLDYARELGLDAERLDRDIDGDAVKNKVQADVDGGNSAGVNSTPTFYVNGKKLSGFRTLDEFKFMVLSAAPDANP